MVSQCKDHLSLTSDPIKEYDDDDDDDEDDDQR